MTQTTLTGDEAEERIRGEKLATERRYICMECESIVRARWFGPGSFAVGCDCTTVPVVPQMGQAETPDKWRVERPECCRGVHVNSLDVDYGDRGVDYVCPECGAGYRWNGKLAREPTDLDAEEVSE